MNNKKFWADYIKNVILPKLQFFKMAFNDKIISSFDSIEEEAKRIEEEKYRELLEQPWDPENDDISNLADDAIDAGVDYFIISKNIQQGIINLFFVGARHLFEQELLFILRKEILPIKDENNIELFSHLNKVIDKFKKCGIDLGVFKTWNKLEELSLISNVIKHGDGVSAEKLKKTRPDLFIHPDVRDDLLGIAPPGQVFSPLGGEDLYVSSDGVLEYVSAIEEFWEEFIKKLK